MDRRRLMMNDVITTLSGKTITCEKCKGSKFSMLKLFGKSEQLTSTGSNLFNVDSKLSGFVSGMAVGNTVEISQNASFPNSVYFDEISVDPAKRYSFCFYDGNTVLSNDYVRVRIYNDNNVVTETSARNNIANKKFATGTTKIRILILDEFPNLRGMFNEGSTLKTYEPYTGSKPSPSPDYPQDIISSSDGEAIALTIQTADGQSESVSASTELRGIPVSSGGDYTDADGKQWICDSIDFIREQITHKIGKWEFDNQDIAINETLDSCVEFIISDNSISGSNIPGLMKKFQYSQEKKVNTFSYENGALYFRLPTGTTTDQAKEIMTGEILLYVVDMVPSEIISIDKTLHTFADKDTVVSSGTSAWITAAYRKVR